MQNEISSEDKEDKKIPLFKRLCNQVVQRRDGIRYALFDMTGDEIPELHILTDISYSIHAVEERIILWNGLRGSILLAPLIIELYFRK